MTELVESSTRGRVDCVHFAIVFFSIIGTAAGVVLVSPCLTLLGLAGVGYGIVYFLIREWLERGD